MEQVTLPTVIAAGFLILSFIVIMIFRSKNRDR